MGSGFQKRKSTILRIIVGEYIATAMPVASEFISRHYDMGVSPATIRNDVARLEEEGYLTRPHTSAGTVPSGKAYRHFVQALPDNIELPVDEQERIRRSFMEVEEEIDKWLKVAALIVSHMAGNVSIVTFPKARRSRFKHLELVAIHEFLAMLILVLSETSVKQHLLSFSEPMNQEELSKLANKFNSFFAGRTFAELTSQEVHASEQEQRLIDIITEIMEQEDESEYSKPILRDCEK
jgi:heat-inducible transcriptional repressor